MNERTNLKAWLIISVFLLVTGDKFGVSVSVWEDVAIVGSYNDDDKGSNSGSAYIYRLDGSNWVEEAKLVASDGAAYDGFGCSVDIYDDVAIVGAYGDDVNGAESGSAYIFRFNDPNWDQEAKLVASDGAAGDEFARHSVGIYGDAAVVGAYLSDVNGPDSGAAYVFRFNGSTWVQETQLVASDTVAGDEFGYSVDIWDETIVIGADHDDDNGSNSGSAYIFRFYDPDWYEEDKLLASDGAADDFFGSRVGIFEETVVVGATHDDDKGVNSGSAYIFRYDVMFMSWDEEAKLTASDGAGDDRFGCAVDISGDFIVIGSHFDDDSGGESGSAYVFGLDDYSMNWVEEEKLVASDAAAADRFGVSASISGHTAIVGAFYNDEPGKADIGSAYIFGVPPTKFVQYPDLDDTGIDVDASMDFMGIPPHFLVLADDFNCIRTDPITDIHVWGSWYHDELPEDDPQNVIFMLSIHADIAVDDPCNFYGYSHPGEILWEQFFMPDEFEVIEEAFGITEGYYDPNADYYEPNADWTCWRYEFYIDPCEAFVQQGTSESPVVYWLGVQALTESMGTMTRFGWKTSLDHWNDSAVWAMGDAWFHDPWQELLYPSGHPFDGNPIDLAFSISTEGGEPNDVNWLELQEPNYIHPLMSHTKWSQPPVPIDPNSEDPNYCGWYEDSDNIDIWHIAADDFRCLGTMPVTSVHWWGNYIDWDGNEPLGVEPNGWRIGFWSNVADPDPFDPCTFSRPDELLWQIEVDYNPLTVKPSMISYWKFDEGSGTSAEDSANGNNGTLYGPTWPTGIEGSALNFRGGGKWHKYGDVVVVPHSPSLDITDDFTIEAWIKATGTDKYHMIVDKHNGSASISYGYSLYLTDGNLRLSIYSGANGIGDYSVLGIDLRDDQWHHVAGLWDSNDIKLYIDGEFKASEAWDFGPASTGPSRALGIGKRIYGWGGYLPFEGLIDEVAIHDRDLTAGEIKARYQAGLGLIGCDVIKDGDSYEYSMYLEPNEYFWQDDFNDETVDNTFWLSIMAVYPNDVDVNYLWGWQTRPWHWMDDAVIFSHDPVLGPLEPGMNLDPCSIEPIKDPCLFESYDMAFELDTDPNWIKWEQMYMGLRNWPHYEDVESTYNWETWEIESIVADDFRCLKRTPITAVVWWGSYMGYGYEACTDPVIRPEPPDKFRISFWSDVPAGADPCTLYSHPGEEIWQFDAYEYDEVLVGYDKSWESDPNEPVFRYSVRLPEENWFHQPDYEGIFWLSVQAIYDFSSPDYFWGWTNHQHVFNDGAVQHFGSEIEREWYELYDQTEESADMSFMLFTDPKECSSCANYNLDIDPGVNFLDYAEFSDNWYWIGQPGGYNNGDLNCDGGVDEYDLEIFAMQWLDYCPLP
ncbi:MAG: DUF7901 domain-containing protein [Planctomycetota bacterium]|jgi:hypothetical protein